MRHRWVGRACRFLVAKRIAGEQLEPSSPCVLLEPCCRLALLNVTNLDREPEWGRYLRMPAGSQNEDQSPLGQGALARTSTFSAA